VASNDFWGRPAVAPASLADNRYPPRGFAPLRSTAGRQALPRDLHDEAATNFDYAPAAAGRRDFWAGATLLAGVCNSAQTPSGEIRMIAGRLKRAECPVMLDYRIYKLDAKGQLLAPLSFSSVSRTRTLSGRSNLWSTAMM
jgi:hypothetical protein